MAIVGGFILNLQQRVLFRILTGFPFAEKTKTLLLFVGYHQRHKVTKKSLCSKLFKEIRKNFTN